MPTLGSGTMIAGWVAVLLAAPTMLVIAWHVLSVQQSSMPQTRKRVRIANGLLMMFVAALLAYALGMAPVPDSPRTEPDAARVFVLVWSGIVGLLFIVVALAVADALMTTREGYQTRKAIRREMAAAFREPEGVREDSTRG